MASMSLIGKFAYYQSKYGIFHAVASYIGRYNQYFWKIIGPTITRRYLDTWLETSEFRLINLGGGSNCFEGCLTVDIDPRADTYVDITKKLPFDNASIDAIFCEEVLEHVDLQLGRNLLKECWRILKPGGIIRIATPNLNWFTEQSSNSLTACDNINNIFYEHGHRYLYTQQALEFYCQETGFTNLNKSTYKDNESRLGYLDSHAERFNHSPEISQYLEAQKPVQ
ncbi:MAG: methyltransferase domain-containing protein [Moorea sp. SIO3G5]|nr:methyltransferase domain-containing protein [Moorena sp. SIO3G5]